MDLRFSGTDDGFLTDGFFDAQNTLFSIDGISNSPSRIVFRNTDTGYVTTLTGFGFANVAGTTFGLITGMSFSLNGVVQGSMTDVRYSLGTFFEALAYRQLTNSTFELTRLINAGGPLSITAASAQASFDMAANLGDIMPGLFSAITITGSRFDDVLLGGTGSDTINGGAGTDTYILFADREDIRVDAISGGVLITSAIGGTDRITNVERFDLNGTEISLAELLAPPDLTLLGDTTNDSLSGKGGNDTLRGGLGDDSLAGGTGNDAIWGDGDNDTLNGGGGNDTLRGGRGQDTVEGGAGNDVIRGQREGDRLDGGSGSDNVKGGGGNDTIFGGDGNDFLVGGTRRDVMFGGNGNDRLIGNSFDDDLNGGGGNDTLIAGGQNDTLNGGTGDDFLRGGADRDRFEFTTGYGSDTIGDFNVDDDTLQLSLALTGTSDVQTVLDQALIGDRATVFDFGDTVITLAGLTSTDGLEDALVIV